MLQKHRFLYRFLLALLLFGFNGIIASRISLESGQIVLLRTLLGSLSLLLFFFLSGHRFSFSGRGKDVILICLSGAAMGASLCRIPAYRRFYRLPAVLLLPRDRNGTVTGHLS